MTPEQKELLRALLAASKRTRFDARALCTKDGRTNVKQLELVSDTSRHVVVCAGRRHGKTIGAVLKAYEFGLGEPDVSCVITASTEDAVKKLAWGPLVAFNEECQLGGDPMWGELEMRLPNGSTIYLIGCDTVKLANRLRGIQKLKFVCLDELQSTPDETAKTLEKVALPALKDKRGTIWLMGSPNPAGQLGLLWERLTAGKYSRHDGTIYDNVIAFPTRADIEAQIDEDLEAIGETREGAWYRREFLAEWAVDLASRAYQFSDDENTYAEAELPSDLTQSVICVDLGASDEDAIGVLEWHEEIPVMYLTHEDCVRGQTDQALAEKLKGLYDTKQPLLIVIDAGGGGKKTFISLQEALPDLPLVQARKPELKVQIRTLNSLMQAGKLKVLRDSRFAADVRIPTWLNGVVGGKLLEHGVHSNIVPSVRYGVEAARPFLPELDEVKTAEQVERERKDRDKAARMERARRLSAGPVKDEDDFSTLLQDEWEDEDAA